MVKIYNITKLSGVVCISIKDTQGNETRHNDYFKCGHISSEARDKCECLND